MKRIPTGVTVRLKGRAVSLATARRYGRMVMPALGAQLRPVVVGKEVLNDERRLTGIDPAGHSFVLPLDNLDIFVRFWKARRKA